jgi:hypothetical protein
MIAQSRLIEIRNLAAADSAEPFRVHSHEMVAICDELMRYRDESLVEVSRAERNQPAVTELAERLAKVEDRLAGLVTPADNYGSILTRLDAAEEKHEDLWKRTNKLQAAMTERIDRVVDIVGERIGVLVARINEIDGRTMGSTLIGAFPTGGADTAEAAADAVLPVPQRGDRVRLEGARTLNFYPVPDGWHEVTGQNGDAFQIRVPQFGGDWLPYLLNTHEGLKEVKSNGKT